MNRYIRGVFAWLMRLLIAGCMGALVFAFAPTAVDNFRATQLGIHGTITVTSCDRGDCRGSFRSDNGEVSRTDLELFISSINDAVDLGATVECWITDPSAERGYVSRFWLLHTLSMSLLVLLFSLGLLLLTPDRIGRPVRVRAAVQEAAASNDLGASEGSYRWTKYLALYPGLLLTGSGLGMALSFAGSPNSFGPSGGLVGVTVMSTVLFLAGGYFLVHTARRIGRRLHLYEHGIIVSRGRRCEVRRYESVVAAKVDEATPENSTPYPYAVRLEFLDGNRVKVNHRNAVSTVLSHVSDRIR